MPQNERIPHRFRIIRKPKRIAYKKLKDLPIIFNVVKNAMVESVYKQKKLKHFVAKSKLVFSKNHNLLLFRIIQSNLDNTTGYCLPKIFP